MGCNASRYHIHYYGGNNEHYLYGRPFACKYDPERNEIIIEYFQSSNPVRSAGGGLIPPPPCRLQIFDHYNSYIDADEENVKYLGEFEYYGQKRMIVAIYPKKPSTLKFTMTLSNIAVKTLLDK